MPTGSMPPSIGWMAWYEHQDPFAAPGSCPGRPAPLAAGVWPSIEAAAAAGVRGGFLLVGEVLPADEWARLAVPYMRQLTEGHHHAIEL